MKNKVLNFKNLKKPAIGKRAAIPAVIAGAFLFYMMLILMRGASGYPLEIGEQPYIHTRAAEQIARGSFSGYDPMLLGGRTITLTPYHFLLAGAILLRLSSGLAFIPIGLSIVSLVFLYLLLREAFPKKTILVVLALTVTSPPFIYLSLVSNPQSLAVALTLAGLFFFLKKGKLFATAALFSLYNILIITALCIVYSAYSLHHRKRAAFVLAVLGAVFITHPVHFYPVYEFSTTNILEESISGLGGAKGFSVFFVILAVIGFFDSWSKKKRHYPLYLLAGILIVSFFMAGNDANMYAVLPLAVLAAFGVSKVTGIVWKVQIIRKMTYLLIICGIIFSTLSYSIRLATAQPSDETLRSLEWLKSNSRAEGTVLSHHSSGYWIEAVAERKVLIDSHSSSIPDFDQRYMDIYSLFHATELEEADAVLYDTYGVDYIWITREMKEGKVWKRQDEGLLFLLRNNETFKNIYSSDETEIWRVIRKSE